MGRRLEQTFFQRSTDGQQAHEKTCNITHHQGNTNQQWAITSYLSEWLKSTAQKTTGVGKDVSKRELSCTVGGNGNWCSHSEKRKELPQKVKNRTILQPRNCTTRYLPKEYKIPT